MLLVRRRLWTPSQIRHLPAAYRFLTPQPASTARADAEKAAENVAIELPPPPRQTKSGPASENDTASEEQSNASYLNFRVEGDVSRQETTDHSSSPPPRPEPRDQSITTGPSMTAELAERLRIWSELTKTRWHERTSQWTASAVTGFSQLGGQLNQVTGYEEINALKKQVVAQGV
jgi:hypothetical protein